MDEKRHYLGYVVTLGKGTNVKPKGNQLLPCMIKQRNRYCCKGHV